MTILTQLPAWLQGDEAKIAIFVGFLVAFFGLARWASAATEKSTQPHPDLMLPLDRGSEIPQLRPTPYPDDPQGAVDRAHAPRHPETRYGDVEVRDLNFKSFEAMVGPPDPTCFCDEIMLDLYNAATDHRYTMGCVVATPDGLRKALDDKKWDIMYLPMVYVVKRYDLRLIRDTILEVSDEGEEGLEDLAPGQQEVADPFKRIVGGG